jgi:hypothetical protein
MANFLKKRKEQLSQIIEAFSQEELPVGEKWYQERLAICTACPHNSDNVAKENKTFVQNIRENIITCPQVRYCTACSCCIDQKASIKRAECGAVELGLEAKWKALEVFANDNSNVSVTQAGDRPLTIRTNGSTFFLDLGKTSEPVVDFSFVLFVPTKYEFVTSKVTCGCTVAEVEKIDEARTQFNMRISTVQFNPGGITTRTFYAEYKGKTVELKFQIEKINPESDELQTAH